MHEYHFNGRSNFNLEFLLKQTRVDTCAINAHENTLDVYRWMNVYVRVWERYLFSCTQRRKMSEESRLNRSDLLFFSRVENEMFALRCTRFSLLSFREMMSSEKENVSNAYRDEMNKECRSSSESRRWEPRERADWWRSHRSKREFCNGDHYWQTNRRLKRRRDWRQKDFVWALTIIMVGGDIVVVGVSR